MGRSQGVRARQRTRAQVLATVVALVAGLIVVLGPQAPVGAAVTPVAQLDPALAGNRSVHHSQGVKITGALEPGVRLQSARLVAYDAAGGVTGAQPFDASSLNKTDATSGEYIGNNNGALVGGTTLGCLFNEPGVGFCDPHAPVRLVKLEIVLADGVTVLSNGTRVDYTRPQVRRYDIIAPNRIRAIFVEPVRIAGDGPDSSLDWQVTDPDAVVVSVDPAIPGDCFYLPDEDATAGSMGCSRTLNLLTSLDGDATPEVSYSPPSPARPIYIDFASNSLNAASGTPAVSRAFDRVRPAFPKIDSVAGKTSSTDPRAVLANDSNPDVVLSNVKEGNRVQLRVVPPTGPEFTTGLVAAPAGGTLTVTLPVLTPDGVYTISAVAIDPSGNRSDDSDKTTADTDAQVVDRSYRYTLDTVAPPIISAITSGSTVRIVFAEPVTGTNSKDDWTVKDGNNLPVIVTNVVAGANASERVLQLAVAAPAVGTVIYKPTPDTNRYRDLAGNGSPDAEIPLNGVPVPTVTVPSAPLFINGNSTSVQGRAQPATRIDLYVDANNDGQPDSATVRDSTITNGAGDYAIAVSGLAVDAIYNFVVIATNTTTSARSGTADVPAITRDSTAPTLTILKPVGGERIAAGGENTYPITWESCDSNFGPGPVETAFSPDNGTTWTVISAAKTNPACGSQGTDSWKVPVAGTTQARIRIRAKDLAANQTERITPAFIIDATVPVFDAVTVDDASVLVRFIDPTSSTDRKTATAQPVTGTVSPLDWTIDDQPVVMIDGSPTPSATPVTRSTLLLRTAPGTVGPNERPPVAYSPRVLSQPFQDDAGNQVPATERRVNARDGIIPIAPTVTSPTSPVLTAQPTYPVAGKTEVGTTVRLQQAGNGPLQGSQAIETGDGSYSVPVTLVPDATTTLEATAVDAAGNDSRTRAANAGITAVPPITSDATPPQVQVLFPIQGDELVNDHMYTVRFRVTDVRLKAGSVRVEYTLDGGRSFVSLTPNGISYNSGDTGQIQWRTPRDKTPEAFVRVTAEDQVNRVGSGTSGIFGIGVPPAVGAVNPLPPGTIAGYWLVAGDGGVFSFGDAPFLGSTGHLTLEQPIVGMAATPSGNGYWMVARDGGVFAFTSARFFGSLVGTKLAQPIVGMAPTPTGRGYWLVAADGGIFAFGDALFHGSTGGMRINQPIVGMAATRTGKGYWLVARDGGVFAFGDALFQGSMGGILLNQPVVGIAPQPAGNGYRMVASDGGIFAFGDAPFRGSTGGSRINQPVVGMATTPSGNGYWMVARDGGVFAFPDGPFLGSMGGSPLNKPMVGMAPRLIR